MNCHEIEPLWDEYRDGTLASAERGRFAAHLAECPRCAALYEQETRWLAEVAGQAHSGGGGRDAWFTEAVLQQWEHEPIRRLRWIKWAGIAAALAIAATVAVIVMAPADERGQIAQGPDATSGAGAGGGGDPVSVLMLDMTRHLDDQPATSIRQALDRTASLSLSDLMDMFDAGDDETTDPLERRGS